MLPPAWTCPKCHRQLDKSVFGLAAMEGRVPLCPFCGNELGIARSYSQFLTATAAVFASIIGALMFRSDSSGAWLLGVIALFLTARLLLWIFVRPWLQVGRRRYRLGVSVFIVAIAIEMFLYGAVLGGAAMILGTQRDVREQLEFFSVPLAWISRRFLITSESGILDVLGTIVGNGFFLGPLIYLCWSVVSRAFARSRPIELSISHDHKDEDE